MQPIHFSTLRLTAWKQTFTQSNFITLCTILFPPLIIQSEEVPLDIAINRAVQFAQIDRLDEAAMEEARSFRESAALLPNPSFFYEREDLRGASGVNDSRETTAGFSAPLDFIWKRSARVEAADLRGKITQYHIENQRREMARGIAVLYSHYAANLLTLERHEAAHVALDRARNVAQARVGAGDAPPTLMSRVEIAISHHAIEERLIETELLSICSRIAVLIGEIDAKPSSHDWSLVEPPFTGASEALEAALVNRPDLKAAKALFEWKHAEQKVAKQDGLPDVALEAAHKEDNAGRDGFLLGLSVEVPIFDRGQGSKLLANSERIRAQVALHRAQLVIEGEVKTAYDRWKQLSKNTPTGRFGFEVTHSASNFLEATGAKFEAGEAELLEYLDAVEAYLLISEEEVEMENKLRLAAIDLAHATAIPLTRLTF